ncbi:Uncharacterised protein [Bordetella pertussis]|nr:Uncharacterised protein [Bordetella pertussis]
MPPAPARFSTITDCFSSSLMARARPRAAISVIPPGG